MEKISFKINGQTIGKMTMAEAIDKCRALAIKDKRTVNLYALNNTGGWSLLGTYKPDEIGYVIYTDYNKETFTIPCCRVEPQPRKRRPVTIKK